MMTTIVVAWLALAHGMSARAIPVAMRSD